MLIADTYAMLGLGHIFEKVVAGERLSLEDGARLYSCADIHALGALAHYVRLRLHGHKTYYVLNRQVNYTNVCVNGCLFCAFRRDAGQEGAYVMSPEDILARITEHKGLPFTELHMVGGCHPSLPIEWFEDIICRIKVRRPDIVVKAFTAVEICHFATQARCSTQEILLRLRDAGLAAMPGGGAEIFAPRVRGEVCPRKISADEWLRVAGEAHSLGISTNCTMLFGHIESLQDRLDHLDRLRRQQDISGGFTCFIPLPFLTKNSKLKLPEERVGEHVGMDRLRTIAISRLLLDNIPHIKAYWVMLGHKMAQTALYFGADDLDGTIVEERIGQEAGSISGQGLTTAQLRHMISASGFVPIQRDTFFNPVEHTA